MQNRFTSDAFPGFTFANPIVPVPMLEIDLTSLDRVMVGGDLQGDRIDGNEFVKRLLATGNTFSGVGYLATLILPENWGPLWEIHFDWRKGTNYFYEEGCYDEDGDPCILWMAYNAGSWVRGSTKLKDDYWFNEECFGVYSEQQR